MDMEAEEYIKLKRIESYPGGKLSYTVTEEDALKAIEMVRNGSAIDYQKRARISGWVCPKCGSVYSPYALECSYCNSFKNSKV